MPPSALFISTIIFALFVVGLLRARTQSRFNPLNSSGRYNHNSAWSMLHAEGAHFIIPIWMAQVIDSVCLSFACSSICLTQLSLSHNSSRLSWRLASMVSTSSSITSQKLETEINMNTRYYIGKPFRIIL
jgi:hypothetical protein